MRFTNLFFIAIIVPMCSIFAISPDNDSSFQQARRCIELETKIKKILRGVEKDVNNDQKVTLYQLHLLSYPREFIDLYLHYVHDDDAGLLQIRKSLWVNFRELTHSSASFQGWTPGSKQVLSDVCEFVVRKFDEFEQSHDNSLFIDIAEKIFELWECCTFGKPLSREFLAIYLFVTEYHEIATREVRGAVSYEERSYAEKITFIDAKRNELAKCREAYQKLEKFMNDGSKNSFAEIFKDLDCQFSNSSDDSIFLNYRVSCDFINIYGHLSDVLLYAESLRAHEETETS